MDDKDRTAIFAVSTIVIGISATLCVGIGVGNIGVWIFDNFGRLALGAYCFCVGVATIYIIREIYRILFKK